MKSDFSEELLFALDDEDLASLEEDSCFAEDEDVALLEDEKPEELDAIMEPLLDLSLLLWMTSEDELLAGTCDELDSTEDDETVEDDSVLELLDCELPDSPYVE